MDINRALTLEYSDYMIGLADIFQNEYNEQQIYSSIGNTIATFYAFRDGKPIQPILLSYFF